ncbi:MAG: aldolase [Nitrososphaerota archaeon]|jgi:class I fructose-bisphosphate aldolase|nr:aldolase [Nitrososphaerota archaeon]MDG7040301.1 aldolase [Nitrososphaerota archaeon]MDG7042672.1 aldolase [Nitrososphaerota archaeon]
MSFERFMERGRSMIIAYDHGIEHGPTDFNDRSADPQYIMDIAEGGQFNGIALQKGIAEKYYNGRIPLILKLNGKTEMVKGDPISRQNCSVEYALSLKAKAVGYTIYPGSAYESLMLRTFGRIQEEARKYDLAVVAWIYPRGEAVKDDRTKEVIAYAARIGLELGADAVKIKYTGSPETFSWAVRAAGKAKVFMSGGPKAPTDEAFLRQVEGVLQAGGAGIAVGRNVWQHGEPLKMAKALRSLIIERRGLADVLEQLK